MIRMRAYPLCYLQLEKPWPTLLVSVPLNWCLGTRSVVHCLKQSLKEKLLSPQESTSLLEYVSSFRDRLYLAREHAEAHLESSQEQMKVWYDRRSRKRSFQPGDQLLLSPLPGQPLQASFHGPYVVDRRIGEVDYVLFTPDRRKH